MGARNRQLEQRGATLSDLDVPRWWCLMLQQFVTLHGRCLVYLQHDVLIEEPSLWSPMFRYEVLRHSHSFREMNLTLVKPSKATRSVAKPLILL